MLHKVCKRCGRKSKSTDTIGMWAEIYDWHGVGIMTTTDICSGCIKTVDSERAAERELTDPVV